MHFALGVWVVGEGLFGVGHLQRIVEHDNLAAVIDAQFFERLHHGPCESASVERIVVRDGGALEHEAHLAVGQVDAHGHLGVTLVGTVTDAEPAAHLMGWVETVDVHALVEVRLRAELVHVFVGRIKTYCHVRHPKRKAVSDS